MVATGVRGELRLVTPTRDYVLRLEVGACCVLETLVSDTFERLTAKANRGQMGAVRGLLWAALQPRHARRFPDPASVGPVIDVVGLPAMRRTLAELLLLNADDSDDLQPANGRPSRRARKPVGNLWRSHYLQARSIGIQPEAFWRLSLKELWWELAASRQQYRQRHDAAVTSGWYAAALAWRKSLPDLETLLSGDGSHGLDLLTGLQAISDRYGFPIVTRTGTD